MGRGFLAGIFWGAIVGVAILVFSNMTLDRQQLSFPRPEAVPVEVPAGSEFDQAREETDPVVPEAETRPGGEVASGVTPPPDINETPPAFDTSSLEVPQPSVEGPGGLGEIPDVADEVEVDVSGPGEASPVQPLANADLEVPDAPTTAPDTATEAPVAADAPVSDDESPVTDEIAALAPELSQAPDVTPPADAPATAAPATEATPSADATADAPETGTAPALMAAPEVVEAPSGQGIITLDGGESFFEPVDDIGNLAPQVETDRLPRIGAVAEDPPSSDSAAPTIRRGTDTDTAEIAEEPAAPAPDAMPAPDGPAIEVWRQAGAVDTSKPLFSIVLVHEGEGLPDAASLDALPEAVSFAVDAGLSAASDIAAQYRAAGREVVMIPSLPIGATPQDVEVALRVNMETISEAVAVMDASGESFQSDRAAVAQLVDVVTATGHGLITFPRGLNTAHQRAQREGVPAGLIFRDIDGDSQSDEQIRRAMDRAAFRARIDRPVILVGRAVPLTSEAVVEWSLGGRAASVTLAPVSAALLASPS